MDVEVNFEVSYYVTENRKFCMTNRHASEHTKKTKTVLILSIKMMKKTTDIMTKKTTKLILFQITSS